MAKLTELPTRRVLAALERAGWQVTRGRKSGGKHYKLIHAAKRGALAVPYSTPLKKGLVRAIIKQAGLTVGEFWKLYK